MNLLSRWRCGKCQEPAMQLSLLQNVFMVSSVWLTEKKERERATPPLPKLLLSPWVICFFFLVVVVLFVCLLTLESHIIIQNGWPQTRGNPPDSASQTSVPLCLAHTAFFRWAALRRSGARGTGRQWSRPGKRAQSTALERA